MALLITDEMTTETVTPELIARMFAELDETEQAQFFNEVGNIASKWRGWGLSLQLHCVTTAGGLTLAGRRVMQSIGEYSHLGLIK